MSSAAQDSGPMDKVSNQLSPLMICERLNAEVASLKSLSLVSDSLSINSRESRCRTAAIEDSQSATARGSCLMGLVQLLSITTR